MVKILFINSIYPNGSTGKIIKSIGDYASLKGCKTYYAYGYGKVTKNNEYVINTYLDVKLSIIKTRLFGKHGFYNKRNTKNFLNWINVIKPDIVHLHNVHGHYVNIELLFDHLKKTNTQIIWTMHDCWAFTGHCAHFLSLNCNKWKSGCYECKGLNTYPITYIRDPSKHNWYIKKKLFESYPKLTIVSPSQWLQNQLKESFLSKNQIIRINNGIDLSIFNSSKKYNNKEFVILGFVEKWSNPLNNELIKRLDNMLPKDSKLILVGNKKWTHSSKLVTNAIRQDKIHSMIEMSKLYSRVDLFINLTREDTFPTVNIESLACGTPVATLDSGGSLEIIDKSTGVVIENDLKKLIEFIDFYRINKKTVIASCIKRASNLYDNNIMNERYYNLYMKLSKR